MSNDRNLPDRNPQIARAAVAASLLLAAFMIALDYITPPNLIPPIFYGVPIVIAAWTRNRKFTWALALFLISLTLLFRYFGLINQPDVLHAGLFSSFNRIFSALATLLTVLLVHAWSTTRDTNERQNYLLLKHNLDLEQANRDIIAREEEITRQNEELQAQTEELERQSEELRITNDQLARREKMLERLLELSRNLTAETTKVSRSAILSQLCEALAELTQGNASAILLIEGNSLRVTCHHGFGSGGIAADLIPLSESFASLIISRLQTGYIENMDQRPDLRIPQPTHEQKFNSVLASPLLVRGRLVGTVEIYSHERRTWNTEQISLIESLAAQASISLDVAELFEAVQQERQRFETVFRTMPFPVSVAEDAQCLRVRGNPAAAALLGVTTETNLSPLVADSRRPRAQVIKDGKLIADQNLPLLRAVLNGEIIQNEEVDLILPNNERRPTLCCAMPIMDANGKITGGVVANIDITPLKKLQHELETRRREAEEASVRKTHFLAAISHDIRTPVNAITLTAELIRRSAGNPALTAEIPAMVKELQNNTASLGILVHDLLDVARFDTGKMEFQESEFSLGGLLSEECRQLLPLAHDKGLHIECDNAMPVIWLRADRVKLSRVLANLIGNAIKFTSEGSVRLTGQLTADGRAEIHVIDTGVGIPQEHLARIFDEFTQLRNPERDRYKGTGLGLAISKRIIEAMAGTVSVRSTLGKGSVFTVTLPASTIVPRADFSALQRLNNARRDHSLLGLRVLLIEDHQTTRWATAQILNAEGAIVQEATNGQEGLKALQENRVDALLLDMMLPDMDGRTILEQIQLARPSSLKSVLVLTGDATQERLDLVKSLGADVLISKPIDVDYLIATLRGVKESKTSEKLT